MNGFDEIAGDEIAGDNSNHIIYLPVSKVTSGGVQNTRPKQIVQLGAEIAYDNGDEIIYDNGDNVTWSN